MNKIDKRMDKSGKSISKTNREVDNPGIGIADVERANNQDINADRADNSYTDKDGDCKVVNL